MPKVGDKAITTEIVKVECPWCGATQTEKISIFKDDIHIQNIWLFICFYCHEVYHRYPNGKTEKPFTYET